jgi:hypothetical protein
MYAQPVAPAVPAGLPSALLERRPDLREAEQQLAAANARIGVAKAEFFPRLSLTALFGAASPELSALTGGGATVWAVAGMLSGPLFNAGRTTGQYRASIARWEQARLQYEQAVLGALREVSDALTALGKLSEAETGQSTAVRGLEDAVVHATDRYRQGLASYYEVLEAQQQLYPAQNTLAGFAPIAWLPTPSFTRRSAAAGTSATRSGQARPPPPKPRDESAARGLDARPGGRGDGSDGRIRNRTCGGVSGRMPLEYRHGFCHGRHCVGAARIAAPRLSRGRREGAQR